MSKENILFGLIGLLAGLIIGFMFANSVNQQGSPSLAASMAAQNSNIPPGHPPMPGGQGGQQGMANVPEVQAAIDKARSEPENFDAQMKAAEMFYQIQRFDGAIEFLKKANQLKPDAYEVIVHLGNAHFDADKYEEAEKYYSQALAKKADDVNVRTDLGLTYMFRQKPDYDRAIQEFKRSLEYNPNHAQTLQNLTVAYTKKGDAGNASTTIAQLESLDPANPAVARLKSDIEALKVK